VVRADAVRVAIEAKADAGQNLGVASSSSMIPLPRIFYAPAGHSGAPVLFLVS